MSTTETQNNHGQNIFSRVAAIPLVNESFSTVHSTLINNTYTSSPYNLAQNLGKSAYQYSEPIQIRLAPILVRADGYANKGLDAVESRYPTPFKLTTEDIKQDLNEIYVNTNKVIDERLRNPAYTVVQAIDQRFAPIVDYVEVAVNKLHTKNGDGSIRSPTSDEHYQYQRAFALSKDLREQLYCYSNEQFKQLEKQSVLVQHATSTAHNISDLASSSYVAAQNKVHTLSDTMIQELQKIQASTLTLPAQVQSSLKDVSDGITASIHDIGAVLKSDAPMNEKVSRVGITVQERVQPLLDAAYTRVQEMLKAVASKGQQAKAKTENSVNGRANGNASS